MPVRSLNSSVIKWPDGDSVKNALKAWAFEVRHDFPDVVWVGYFGSYARGDWGVGSDLDIIMIVKRTTLPKERRAIPYSTESLPVPADLLVYTLDEWESLSASESRFSQVLSRETVWL